MFARAEHEAVAAHDTVDLIFGTGAPYGLVTLVNGNDGDGETA